MCKKTERQPYKHTRRYTNRHTHISIHITESYTRSSMTKLCCNAIYTGLHSQYDTDRQRCNYTLTDHRRTLRQKAFTTKTFNNKVVFWWTWYNAKLTHLPTRAFLSSNTCKNILYISCIMMTVITRHRVSTSIHSLTFSIRVMLP